MKSIFNSTDRQDILRRIDQLTPGHQPLWGRMTVTQMVKHCILCEEYYFGKIEIPRAFLGRIFGRFAIQGILKNDETSLQKNAPTNAYFKVQGASGELELEKQQWKKLIEDYAHYQQDYLVHWFFGKMSKEQLGYFVYKHCDHHLRQFGC